MMANPPGESGNGPWRLDLDRYGKLECHRSRTITTVVALAWRELDDARRSKGD